MRLDTVNWFLEHGGSNAESTARIQQSLIKRQIKHASFSLSQLFTNDSAMSTFPEGSCVVVYGSLAWNNQCCRQTWIPGTSGYPHAYRCSTYYAHYGKYLLNRDYLFMPLREIKRCNYYLLHALCSLGDIYIRPDTGNKVFSGQLVNIKNIDELIEQDYDDNFPIMAVISSPKIICTEWRVLICDREVVCGSPYIINGEIYECDETITLPEDKRILKICREIAQEKWQPDIFYIVDIGIYKDEPRLIEINCFNTSGLYYMDTDIVVDKVSQAAIKQHKEEWQI